MNAIPADQIWVVTLDPEGPYDTCQPDSIFLRQEDAEAFCQQLNAESKFSWRRFRVEKLSDRMEMIRDEAFQNGRDVSSW